jgi:hypothetical protein
MVAQLGCQHNEDLQGSPSSSHNGPLPQPTRKGQLFTQRRQSTESGKPTTGVEVTSGEKSWIFENVIVSSGAGRKD